MRRFVVCMIGAVLVLGACSSSSKSAAKVASKPAPKTTTTQPNAIGLRVNADEEAEQVPDKPLTAAQQHALDAELTVARTTAEEYPTVAAAKKAGLIQAGLFTPGAGAHFISMSASIGGLNGGAIKASTPEAWIYDGVSPTSKVVGLMYAGFGDDPPAGFAGPNDHWHRHTNLCVTFGGGKIGIPYPPDGNVTRSECAAKQGRLLLKTFWMVHAWVVPGWKSPQGVFSHANLNLHCGDGTDNTDKTGFCPGT